MEIIDTELNKRKPKWTLQSISYMDWDDVAQIIRIHISKKWDMYDYKQPLAPWLNVIISNQIRNLIRNNYTSLVKPCQSLKCSAVEGDDGCKIWGSQCSACPLYAEWEKRKKPALNLRIPLAIENHQEEVENIEDTSFDLESAEKKVHAQAQKFLNSNEYRIYKMLFIEKKNEEEVGKTLGFKTAEKNRSPGYRQVKNLKHSIIEKIKKELRLGNIDY